MPDGYSSSSELENLCLLARDEPYDLDSASKMHIQEIFFKEIQHEETGTLWSSLPGVEAAGADFMPSKGPCQQQSGRVWAVRQLQSCLMWLKICGVGNEKEKTDEKTRRLEYHRLDPNLAATYQLCP